MSNKEVARQGATAENGEQMQVHILAVPFQYSEGHIVGMLRLAQTLASAHQDVGDLLVTFAYPARFHSIAQKRRRFSSDSSAEVSNAGLRVCVVDDGLPLAEERLLTQELVHVSMSVYQNAIKLLLHDLVQRSQPSSGLRSPPLSCIVSDTFTPWTQDLADAYKLPRVDFWTSTASVYSMGCQLSRLVSNGTLPLQKSCWSDPDKKWSAEAPLIEDIPGLRPFPVTDFPVEFVQPEDVSDFRLQFMLAAFARTREAHAILVHSVYEMERQVFDALQADGARIHAVGPLLYAMASESRTAQSTQHECLDWLDWQPPSSVVYVALGSVANFTSAETHALAMGLEASGHRFLWVIRRDSTAGGTLYDALPEGFLRRTVDKGIGLIVSWSPQTEVLRHRAVGAFFSHCGWNSMLECTWEGVPVIACPRAGEQRSNARWIVEVWRTGVELERRPDGSFTKEAVEKAMKEVLALQGQDGPTYKATALQYKNVVRSTVRQGSTSHCNLVNFIKGLPKPPSSF